MKHFGREKCCSPIGLEPVEAFAYSMPKPRINVVSQLFFCWIDPLFWLGCWRSLSMETTVNFPNEIDSEKLLAVFNKHWENSAMSSRSLPVTLFRCFWKRIAINATLVSAEKGLLIGQCVLLGYFTEYFSISHPSHEETRHAYLHAVGIVIVTFALATVYAHGSLVAQKTGMMARVMVTAAAYTKVLKADHFNGAHTSAGQVISLIGNDANKFDNAFLFLHYVWIGPAYIVVYTVLVYQEIGASAFVALGFVTVLVPAQWFLGWTFNICRHKLSIAAEGRVKRMTETVYALRFIKMCALEDTFTKILHMFRWREFHKVVKTSMIRAISFSLFTIALVVIMLLVFSSYTATGGVLTPKKFFTVLSLTSTLRVTSIHFFALAILNLLDCRVAATRIQEYLLSPNPVTPLQRSMVHGSVFHGETSGACKTAEMDTRICLTTSNLSASWTNKNEELNIKSVTFSVNESTLIRCLLGELVPLNGTVEVRGTLSYTSQEPWIFSGTLRENVLFGSPFEKEWYDTVIEACALDKDIAGFLEGDMTKVGDEGVSLSGGQRARVNLARAVYYKADIYILDDPLSAVDTAVARHIFEKCIGTILKHKLVVLATNQLQFAHKASKLLAMKEGNVVAFCRPCDLPSKGINSAHLVNTRDEDQFKVNWDEDGKKLQCTDLQQERLHLSPLPKRPSIFDAISFRSGRSRQASLFDTTSIYSHTSDTDSSWTSNVKTMLNSYSETRSAKSYHSIGIMMYVRYLLFGSCWAVLLAVMLIFIVGEVSLTAADVWISKWTECYTSPNSSNVTHQLNMICDLALKQRIGWLIAITTAAVVLNVTRIIIIFYVAINASRLLHNKAVLSVLRAPVWFIDMTPIGNIVNCFSKDVSMLDEVLPFMLCDYLMLITRCLAVFALAVSSNAYIIGPAAVFLIIVLCLRWYYLRTSRQLKNLEACACGPLYSHTASTVQGLLTIKTYKKENVVTEYFHQYLDHHSKLWHLCLIGTRWFGMRIDYLTCVFVAVSAFTSVHLATALDGNLVGLGLAYIITLTGMLQYCVRLSGDTECIMLSAERLMRYTYINKENLLAPSGEKRPPDWPQKGEIELSNVSFLYSTNAPLVLKSLNCHIHPGEKIGVVGRTGAGKSSLGALLLELTAHTGTITIDGVDISQIEKQALRRKISFVPQKPVLFSGTLRFNLDPFDENTDDAIWKSLEQVQLKIVVQNMEGGLDSQVCEGGSNFSVGQRQLLCLARALLRKNKVLVLDEVTANVDAKTDVLIQKIIRESFSECTTLIIAHHLHTLMDCDRVLVLDGGRIKEFEHAHMLFQNPNSLFRKMVAQLGSSAASKLHNIAREDFSHRVISSVHMELPHSPSYGLELVRIPSNIIIGYIRKVPQDLCEVVVLQLVAF
eukprot:Em0024g219a